MPLGGTEAGLAAFTEVLVQGVKAELYDCSR
jgi:hypothetical protein